MFFLKEKIRIPLLVACFLGISEQAVSQAEIFQNKNFTGTSTTLQKLTVYRNNAIPGNLNNKISSLKLQKGHMAVVANNGNGTGMSRAYISVTSDLEIELPDNMNNRVSFIRIMTYNPHRKKGVSGTINSGTIENILDEIDAGWYYNWNHQMWSKKNKQYTPMAWGAKGADDENVEKLIAKHTISPNLLTFNEPNHCDAQSGTSGLCDVDFAVERYKKLLRTGLRMGSPATTEEAADDWLKEFMDKTRQQNLRVDFINLHWYDWGGWSQNQNRNDNPEAIFKRFKKYLERHYELYRLPIRITEFNANRNRYQWVHEKFLEYAIPYMEETDWIEGYVFFSPSNLQFFDGAKGQTTQMGDLYSGFNSTRSIKMNALGENSLTVN